MKYALIIFLIMVATPAIAGTSLSLRDATGQKVGKIIGVSVGATIATVLLKIDRGQRVPVSAFASYLFGASQIWFQDEGCTGPPWIKDTGSVFPATAVHGSRMMLYVQIENIQRENREMRSRFERPRSDGSTDTCEGVEQIVGVFPADRIMDLMDTFTPPFTVRVTTK